MALDAEAAAIIQSSDRSAPLPAVPTRSNSPSHHILGKQQWERPKERFACLRRSAGK